MNTVNCNNKCKEIVWSHRSRMRFAISVLQSYEVKCGKKSIGNYFIQSATISLPLPLNQYGVLGIR